MSETSLGVPEVVFGGESLEQRGFHPAPQLLAVRPDLISDRTDVAVLHQSHEIMGV